MSALILQKLNQFFRSINPSYLLLIAFVIGSFITGVEIFFEPDRVSVFEFLFDSLEKTLMLTGAGGIFYLLQKMQMEKEQRSVLKEELEVAKVEGSAWRKKAQVHINGVGAEIDKQLAQWSFSEAERDIALLMIKGLSHKEIANLRGTSEATVRQQARIIYQKSGLSGKAAFSAFFFEDLMPGKAEAFHNHSVSREQ